MQLDVWFPFGCKKKQAHCHFQKASFLYGSLWFMLTDRIYVVSPNHMMGEMRSRWSNSAFTLEVKIILFGIIAPKHPISHQAFFHTNILMV